MIDGEATIELLKKQQKYLYIARDRSIFQTQSTEMKSLLKEIKGKKEEFIQQQNEKESRKWLSIENCCLSIIEGLSLFIDLKDNKPDSAWDHLITAQNHASWTNREYDLGGDFQKNYIYHFNNIEKIIFPPVTFVSAKFTSVHSKCSICDKEYSECDHIRGEVYMGRSCAEICTEMKDFEHVAVVSEPDDKKCRHASFGNGVTMKNVMTLLDEEMNNSIDS